MDDQRAHIIGIADNLEKEGPLCLKLGELVRDALHFMELLSVRVLVQVETKAKKAAQSSLKASPVIFGENPAPPMEELLRVCKSEDKVKKLLSSQHGRKALCEKVFKVCPQFRVINLGWMLHFLTSVY